MKPTELASAGPPDDSPSLEKAMRMTELTRQSLRSIVLLVCCTAALADTTSAASTQLADLTPGPSTFAQRAHELFKSELEVNWTLPADAEGRMKSTPRPMARAIAREGVRLAGDPPAGSGDDEWSRVRKLAPGTEIVVTVQGSQPGERYVVRANASDLTVLNVADPPLSAAAIDVLRDVASSHPEYFSATQQGGTFVLEKSLRLRRDGLFLGDRKVADLEQVVENIARNDVAEIKTRQKGRGVWGHLGPLGGYFVGAMSGGFVAGFACQATVGRDRCDTGAFLTGALVGGITGGIHGFRRANRETEKVVYRAP